MERAEAIKKLRQMSLPKETMEILEALAPELKESDDEKIRKAIINSLDIPFPEDNLPGTDVTYKEAVAWLEKQKDHFRIVTKMVEQKPAEWSEEDEDMLNSCISSIEEAKENRYAYKETDGDTSYDHEIDWLKSLRPSWKPSEEQMEALERCVEYLEESDNEDADILAELHEQLKQL